MKKRRGFISYIRFVTITILLSISIKNYSDDVSNVKARVYDFEEESQDLIYLYDEYLSILGEYYKDLDLDNIFEKYSFMLQNGYLSYGNRFDFEDPELDPNKYGGIDVINGRGVCRNVNCCFTDLLKKMGYDAGNIYGVLEYNELALAPNHVLTWVKKDDKLYLYDALNNKKFIKHGCIYLDEKSNMLFIPSYLSTNMLDNESNIDTLLIPGYIDSTEVKIHNISEYEEFEKNNLSNLEKEVYIKIKSLQSN